MAKRAVGGRSVQAELDASRKLLNELRMLEAPRSSTALGRLREIVWQLDTRQLELYGSLATLVWALFLFWSPGNTFASDPEYHLLGTLASESMWAMVAVFATVGTLAGLLLGHKPSRGIAAIVQFVFWTFLTVLIGMQSHWLSISVAVYAPRAVASGLAYVRTSVFWRAVVR